jgi:cell cycle checkpoint protein
LSKELHFNITEWKNASDDVFTNDEYGRSVVSVIDFQLKAPPDSISQKFLAFLNRASGLTPLATSSRADNQNSHRQVVLLEDLPNLLHAPTLQMFQSAVADHIENSEHPIVLIISHAGSRGEHRDEEGWLGRHSSVMDVRTIIPPSLLQSPYITRIE